MPLVRRFLILASLYSVGATLLFGFLATSYFSSIIIERRGDVVAAIGQRLLAPVIAGHDLSVDLPAPAEAELDAAMADPILSAEFPYLDIWSSSGRVIYSNISAHEGKIVLPSAEIENAFDGRISVKFSRPDARALASGRIDPEYIEFFFPLRSSATGEVVAVAELREVVRGIKTDLQSVALSSWGTVATMSVVIVLGLFGIVVEGSRTIDHQRKLIARRLVHSRSRAERYREMQVVAEQATRNVTLLTDKHLRTIGADLHDGPAQTISFAVLKLDNVRRQSEADARSAAVSEIENVLAGALGEIRSIAMALVLPDIGSLDIAQVIDNAVGQHMRRTGVSLNVDNRAEAVHVSPEVSVCVFRFVQEGLNNALKHGLPDDQNLTALTQQGVLKLSISNRYEEGVAPTRSDHFGIGLYGLRARVQSVGGNFVFVRTDGVSRLEMWLPYAAVSEQSSS